MIPVETQSLPCAKETDAVRISHSGTRNLVPLGVGRPANGGVDTGMPRRTLQISHAESEDREIKANEGLVLVV